MIQTFRRKEGELSITRRQVFDRVPVPGLIFPLGVVLTLRNRKSLLNLGQCVLIGSAVTLGVDSFQRREVSRL